MNTSSTRGESLSPSRRPGLLSLQGATHGNNLALSNLIYAHDSFRQFIRVRWRYFNVFGTPLPYFAMWKALRISDR